MTQQPILLDPRDDSEPVAGPPGAPPQCPVRKGVRGRGFQPPTARPVNPLFLGEAVEISRVVEGCDYAYLPTLPRGRRGCRYRVLRFVSDESAGQPKVLVVGIDGPDADSWLVYSLAAFANRFRPC